MAGAAGEGPAGDLAQTTVAPEPEHAPPPEEVAPLVQQLTEETDHARAVHRGLERFLPPIGGGGGIVAFAVLLIALLLMPYFLRLIVFGSDLVGQRKAASYLALVYVGMIFAIAALGLAILIGYTGLLSLGHAGFLAVGGYGMAILTSRAGFGLNPWLVFPVAVALAAAISGILGLLSVRLRGFYFTVMTLVFLPVGFAFTQIYVSITGGSQGRKVESRLIGDTATFFGYRQVNRVGDRAAFYLLVMAFLLGTILVLKSLVHSRF